MKNIVYQEENLQIQQTGNSYTPKIRHKSFMKMFDYWTTICRSQFDDAAVNVNNLEDAIILGRYLSGYRHDPEKYPLLNVGKNDMDMSKPVVDKILQIRKSNMSQSEINEIKQIVEDTEKNKPKL
jgi:hypothetical protein